MGEFSIVGKSVPRVDALAKVTGKAQFVSDFKERDMLHLKILRSPYPHARILDIDTSKAKKLLGVRAIVTGQDQPDRLVGGALFDQFPIARDVVRFSGEAVVVVAADTNEIAEDALGLIDVAYEELPAVFDVEEAMRPDCPAVLHPDLSTYNRIPQGNYLAETALEAPNIYSHWKVRHGDVEKGFRETEFILENRYYVPRINHACLETHRSDAWLDSEGVLTMRSSKQGAYFSRPWILHYLGLLPSQYRQLEPYVGGGFGGKGGDIPTECIPGLIALKTGRPVRILYTREEDLSCSFGRLPMVIYIKDGVKKDGTLVAREMRVLCDSGAYSQFTPFIIRNSSFGAIGTYRIPNFKWDSYGVYTNNICTGGFRGFGSPQPTWAIEQQMDMIAEKLGIDPVELRKKNILKEGEKDANGRTTHSIGVERCLDNVVEWLEYGKPAGVDTGPWKRGKGIAVGNKYTVAGTASCVHVKLHPDKTLEVRHSVSELGQGINTVLAQIAAEEFGISVDNVKIVWGDSAFTPFDAVTGSSRSTWHSGNALLRACQDAKRQLFELVAPRMGVDPKDLETRDWQVFARGFPGKVVKISDLFSPIGYMQTVGEIMGKGEYACPYVPEEPDTGQSERPIAYYAYGAYGVEVAVNIETGEVKILRIGGCFDMGQPINPKMCEQQIEGGIGMGTGAAIYEELFVEKGVLINPSFMEYKLPTTMEIPSGGNVKAMIAGVPHKEGPFGAKGLGESVLVPLLPAVGNAFYNATGVRIRDLPLTRERVLKALKEAGKALG